MILCSHFGALSIPVRGWGRLPVPAVGRDLSNMHRACVGVIERHAKYPKNGGTIECVNPQKIRFRFQSDYNEESATKFDVGCSRRDASVTRRQVEVYVI